MLINLLATAWQTLLEQFDLATVLTVLLFSFFAILEVMRGIDYFKGKKKDQTKEEQNKEQRLEELEVKENDNESAIQSVQLDLTNIKESVNLLVESDKDDIRAWITEKYHYFTDLGYIDDFTLDCIERRFKSYKQEGGNTYIDGMMSTIRKLPRRSYHHDEH